jgi:hypothetical protein
MSTTAKKYLEASKRTPLNKIPQDYTVKASQHLARKGIVANGLYTQKALPNRYVVAEYLGKQLTLKQALNKKTNRSYMFDVKVGKKIAHVLDAGNKKLSSFARYANSADYDDQQNVKFVQKDRKIYLVTNQKIPPNTELLTWYGKRTADVIRQT